MSDHRSCKRCTLVHTPKCRSTLRTWPSAPLLEAAGSHQRMSAALGWKMKGFPDQLSDVQADRYATALGLHPTHVWGWEWIDAALTVLDRQYLDSGWRQAWAWAEDHPSTGDAA